MSCFPCRRWKLQVLDLRNTGRNFWNMWSGARAPVRSPAGPVAEDASRTRPHLAPLEVFVDLSLSQGTWNQFVSYLVWWAKQREGALHLCCKTLKVFGAPVKDVEKVLAVVQPGCIREVEVNGPLSLSTLGAFAASLGQMGHLHSLVLSSIHVSASEEREQGRHVSRFASQFLRLRHLRKLYLQSPSFLRGRLRQTLR